MANAINPETSKFAITAVLSKNVEGPERRRSCMHDNFDVSFDNSPAKRKLPFSTTRANFNLSHGLPQFDNVLSKRHMFFSPKRFEPMKPDMLACQILPKKDPKEELNTFSYRNRKSLAPVKSNNTQKFSDTFGSSFNQASRGALEKLQKNKMPGELGWACKDIPAMNKLLSSPSSGSIDEHHFNSDLRKTQKRCP